MLLGGNTRIQSDNSWQCYVNKAVAKWIMPLNIFLLYAFLSDFRLGIPFLWKEKNIWIFLGWKVYIYICNVYIKALYHYIFKDKTYIIFNKDKLRCWCMSKKPWYLFKFNVFRIEAIRFPFFFCAMGVLCWHLGILMLWYNMEIILFCNKIVFIMQIDCGLSTNYKLLIISE